MSTSTLTNAATANIDAFLAATTPDIDTLEAVVGFALQPVHTDKPIVLCGPHNTGKSTLLALIRETTSSYAANNQIWLPGRIGQACRALGAGDRVVTVDDFALEGPKAKAMFATMVAHDYVDFQHNGHPLMVTRWAAQLFLACTTLANAPVGAPIVRCPNNVEHPDRKLFDLLQPEAEAWANRCLAKAQPFIS